MITKEQKLLRDEKIREMLVKNTYLDNLSTHEIKYGSKHVVKTPTKEVVIYDNLYKITNEQIHYIKSSLIYFNENCGMNRHDLLNRLKYMNKKNWNSEVSTLIASITVFGK